MKARYLGSVQQQHLWCTTLSTTFSTTIMSFLPHTLSHTQIQNAFFWYCGRSNLIYLYFTIDKHTVWHGGCHMFGQALCDILPARKRLGRSPTTIPVSVYYLHKSWFRSVRTALWCGVTLTREFGIWVWRVFKRFFSFYIDYLYCPASVSHLQNC